MTTQSAEQTRDAAPATGGLRFEPIPAATLDEIRAAGMDEAGNRLAVQTDTGGGSPLRCCLRETIPGEKVLLIAYTPPGGRGGYAERGPVFIHAERCGGYRTPDHYPPALSHRQQVVRAYDRDGRIADGVLVSDGEHAMPVIRELLSRPEVTLVQLRNVGFGCYNFAVLNCASGGL
ncbi:MAG TPA: DUF1203 domain-containing protein [Streptosporangiaceae bacterium]|jgi:hypothetical protein